MNRNFALALALVIATAAAGNAFADDITVEATPFTSSMSRAQVQADAQQARASRIDPWAQDYDQLADFRGERIRAEVTVEYIAQRDMVAALCGEDSGSVVLARQDLPLPVSYMASAK